MKPLPRIAEEIDQHRKDLLRVWDDGHGIVTPAAVLVALVLLDLAESHVRRAASILLPWQDGERN
jgi:hypothetical protein